MAWSRRAKTLLALLAVLLASLPYIAGSTIYASRTLQGTARILGQPLIWYEDPGAPNVTVALDQTKTRASVTVNVANKALHIYDYNASTGIVVRRLFVSGIDYTGTVQYFSFQLRILGVNVIGDPNNAGVILGEARIDTKRGSYRYGFYYYAINSTHGYVMVNCSSTKILVDPWTPFTINVTMQLIKTDTYNISWFFSGSYLCSTSTKLKDVSLVGLQLGSPDVNSMYDLFVDDVAIVLVSDYNSITVREDFEDSIDRAFARRHGDWRYDTVYVTASGASPDPPADRSLGEYIVPVYSGPILHVYTSLPDGYTVASWKNLASAVFTAGYTGYAVPIIIRNPTGESLTDYSARIVLNSTNFDDWSLVKPDGSDIYFTDASGSPLYYWVESIDVNARTAVLWVKIPLLPAYSEATVYLHYGGQNPYTAYRTNISSTTATSLPVYPLVRVTPLAVETFADAPGTAWTGLLQAANYTVVTSATTQTLNLTVNNLYKPNLSTINLFTAVPPGGNVQGTLGVQDYYGLIPARPQDIVYLLTHTVNIQAP